MCVRKDLGEVQPFVFDKKKAPKCSVEDILQDDKEIPNIEDYRISPDLEDLVNLWNEFIQNINVEKLPGFPIWSDRLRDLDPNEDLSQYPAWKQNFILKNNELYVNNRQFIDEWLVRAHQNPLFFGAKAKLEWQAGQTKHPDIWKQIFQLRPSGIRVKVNTYFPALVAIVQTSIIGSRKRFLTPRECARLQSFPENFQPDVKQQQAYKQFGNAVNVGIVKYFAQYMFGEIQDQPQCFNSVKQNNAVNASTNRRIRGRKSKLHDKIRLAKGNAYEPQLFGADGVVAFVNEGFTESYESYRNFIENHDGKTKFAVYSYNNEINQGPRLEEYSGIVSQVMEAMANAGIKVVIMPPLNGIGGTSEEKLNTLEESVASWLNANPESSIEKVYITTF